MSYWRYLAEPHVNIYAPWVMPYKNRPILRLRDIADYLPPACRIGPLRTPWPNPGVDRIQNLQTFDRWGNLIFCGGACAPGEEACQLNGQNNEQPAGAGVYLYVASIAYIDGESGLFSREGVLIR